MKNISIGTVNGLSLIEVLVAVLVLSIGLLGLASLQGFSLQAGQSAYHRTQATNLAYEVADFTRLNRSAALNTCNLPILEQWQSFAASQLPGGDVAASITNCTLGEIQITITWDEERIEDAEDSGEELVVTTRI
ncbi:MAG: type IV pilus modification protein PilV [Wenzhouxiangella sp.]|nr:type IV pilus modification protein PilV [Wenzhouxiangella sp.]